MNRQSALVFMSGNRIEKCYALHIAWFADDFKHFGKKNLKIFHLLPIKTK